MIYHSNGNFDTAVADDVSIISNVVPLFGQFGRHTIGHNIWFSSQIITYGYLKVQAVWDTGTLSGHNTYFVLEIEANQKILFDS